MSALAEWTAEEVEEAQRLFQRLRRAGFAGDFPRAVIRGLRRITAAAEFEAVRDSRVSPCPRCKSASVCFCPEDYP